MESEDATSSLREQALRIALMARPDFFERTMVATLSKVSKSCFKQVFETICYRENYKDCRGLVLQSQEKRKEYFLNKHPHLRTIPHLVWNEYDTVCALVSVGSGLNFTLYQGTRPNRPCSHHREIIIECRYIWNSDFNLTYRAWDFFINTLPHQPSAFFKHAYDIYFHAYGMAEEIAGHHVLEYHMRSPAVSDVKICITDIGGESVPLTDFLEFPSILKAILQSQDTVFTVNGLYKIFRFSGVIIPENYDTYQAYFLVSRYSSFQKLPKKIRQPIIERYNAQHSERIASGKKDSKKCGCFG